MAGIRNGLPGVVAVADSAVAGVNPSEGWVTIETAVVSTGSATIAIGTLGVVSLLPDAVVRPGCAISMLVEAKVGSVDVIVESVEVVGGILALFDIDPRLVVVTSEVNPAVAWLVEYVDSVATSNFEVATGLLEVIPGPT